MEGKIEEGGEGRSEGWRERELEGSIDEEDVDEERLHVRLVRRKDRAEQGRAGQDRTGQDRTACTDRPICVSVSVSRRDAALSLLAQLYNLLARAPRRAMMLQDALPPLPHSDEGSVSGLATGTAEAP